MYFMLGMLCRELQVRMDDNGITVVTPREKYSGGTGA